MDETNELLRAVLGRLEELGAAVKGLTVQVSSLESRIIGLEGQVVEFRQETREHLTSIESRLGHLAEKWMEHDEEIYKLKRR